MNIGVDAAALGMSNAVVASTGDVNSGYWNPAGLVNLKSDQGALISEYQKRGFLPEALVNFLSLIGWNPGGDQEKMPIGEIVRLFDPVTHEEIPGLLPARTTGFRLADPAVPGQARAGDPIRFWLQGAGDNSTLVKVAPW